MNLLKYQLFRHIYYIHVPYGCYKSILLWQRDSKDLSEIQRNNRNLLFQFIWTSPYYCRVCYYAFNMYNVTFPWIGIYQQCFRLKLENFIFMCHIVALKNNLFCEGFSQIYLREICWELQQNNKIIINYLSR